MEKTIMILVMVALVFGYFISMYDKINNIEIFKPKYKIEKQKSKGYDLYNYKVYKNTFIFWSYKFFACGKDGYEDALKWINDDKENKSSEVVYNE